MHSRIQHFRDPKTQSTLYLGWSFWNKKTYDLMMSKEVLKAQKQSLSESLKCFANSKHHSKLSLFPKRTPPKRQREWLESRKLLERLSACVSHKTEFRTPKWSLSHTNLATVAILAPKGVLGVGIDVESMGRKIGRSIVERIKGPLEVYPKALKPIDIWCAKEAAYKAHPKNRNKVLSDFGFLNRRFIRCGENQFRVVLKTVRKKKLKYRIAIAIRVL